MNLNKFIQELRRRNVIKATLAYLAVSWLLLQAGDVIFPILGTDEGYLKILLFGLIALFPFWIVFAWIYEYTGEGFRKTDEKTLDTQVVEGTDRRMDRLIVACLSLAVVLLLSDRIFGFTENLVNSNDEKRASIAVLPFRNLSSDPDNKHFCNGMMEGIRSQLSSIGELIVKSNESVAKLWEKSQSLSDLGKTLNVKYVVAGSVQKVESYALINVELIEVETENVRWNGQYPCELDEVDRFDIQASITKSITDNLRVQILPQVHERIEKIPTNDLAAYQFYLEGNDRLNNALRGKATLEEMRENLHTAEFLFKEAIERDSDFAHPYLGLARIEVRKSSIRGGFTGYQLDTALWYVNHALDLDPDLVEAYVGRALIYRNTSRMEDAKSDLLIAQRLDPNNLQVSKDLLEINYYEEDYISALINIKRIKDRSTTDEEHFWLHSTMGWFNVQIGNMNKARIHFELADSLDINDRGINWYWFSNITGTYDILLDRKSEFYDSSTVHGKQSLAELYLRTRGYDKGREYCEQLFEINRRDPEFTDQRFYHKCGPLLYLTGDEERGEEITRKQIDAYKESLKTFEGPYGFLEFDIAEMYAFLNERDSAIHWLEILESKYVWRNTYGLEEVVYNGWGFRNIQSDPEFLAIIERARQWKAEKRREIEILEAKCEL